MKSKVAFVLLVVFLSSCKSKKRIIPAPKYTPSYTETYSNMNHIIFKQN